MLVKYNTIVSYEGPKSAQSSVHLRSASLQLARWEQDLSFSSVSQRHGVNGSAN